jgi:hypothetical protein
LSFHFVVVVVCPLSKYFQLVSKGARDCRRQLKSRRLIEKSTGKKGTQQSNAGLVIILEGTMGKGIGFGGSSTKKKEKEEEHHNQQLLAFLELHRRVETSVDTSFSVARGAWTCI